MQTDVGGLLFATVLAILAALIAALVGFVGGSYLCSVMYTGEAGESALIVAPLLGLLLGATAFMLTFRKLKP